MKILLDDDRFHDHCGVCGIFGLHAEASKLAYLALYLLCSIVARNRPASFPPTASRCTWKKVLAWCRRSFSRRCLRRLPGDAAIGLHQRYSTAGENVR